MIDPLSNEPPEEPIIEPLEEPLIDQFLKRLPSSDAYYRSYMHQDCVQFVSVSPQYNFFISMSVDGVIKFWHRDSTTAGNSELEFVKKIPTKFGAFTSFSVSYDGKYIATGFKHGKVCIFDISSFDLVNEFDYKCPDSVIVCFFHDPGVPNYLLGVTFSENTDILIVDILHPVNENHPIPEPLKTFSRKNSKPITTMNFLESTKCAISVDEDGVIEFWDYSVGSPKFDYESVFDTDLFYLVDKQLKAISIAVSRQNEYFAICCSDWSVLIYDIHSGKIVLTIPDDMPSSLPIIKKSESTDDPEKINSGENKVELYGLQQDDYDSRVLIERQYRESNSFFCVDFDDTGHIVCFPSMFGLKFFSIQTGNILRMIGKSEKSDRFNSVSLLQNDTTNEMPMAILTSFDKHRIYLFTTKPPESSKRDVQNEKSAEKVSKSIRVKKVAPTKLPTIATLHTTMGSIKFEMYPEECPLTVENFVTHAKRGYFDNIKIHRVVRDFCIQTGDPTGTGIGGESVWGKKFEDEILKDGHTFDEPGMVGMANSGPNTNASQFFLTTQSAPHLNGYHTCWGKVIDGMDILKQIELVPVDLHNHPITEIKLASVTFS